MSSQSKLVSTRRPDEIPYWMRSQSCGNDGRKPLCHTLHSSGENVYDEKNLNYNYYYDYKKTSYLFAGNVWLTTQILPNLRQKGTVP
ncbi:hypothetical protein RUM44_010522 [Polyplax serrata]|uniref:NADH dehydrogenase [ubiquinone] flavoprotein 3, mitochondrial n=1 Tax=Polyplax serrata TaxID=468196 RepID=A0ABR1AVU8_POLSC